ncbi:hypothetical protein [Streptomyces hygroscopicus]|uniref:hypothetical protein n=1 Tax=Streptomyces hygroscopicus TaxID=1912 RepID=UPI001FCAFE37|nr:hypothetical protein [Streptomyces hygroscopicus]BDH12706.1 hypothetical protein HOK021_38850 [Streptomyces hygroscopicus]
MGEILVRTTTSGSHVEPSVDSVHAAQYVALWADGSDAGITGQNLGRTGTKLGEEFQVSAASAFGGGAESVFTAWADDGGTSDLAVRGRAFTATSSGELV